MAERRKLADEAALYDYAVRALGRRMRSVAELKRLMRQRAVPGSEAAIERVVTRLKDQKYLNDTAYATTYAGYRRDNEKFGRLRVISELKARGVHGDVIAGAVAGVYDETNEEQQARAFLQRKRAKQPTSEREIARIFRMLVRAGFGRKTIVTVLKHWNVEDEVLTALEAELADAEDAKDTKA